MSSTADVTGDKPIAMRRLIAIHLRCEVNDLVKKGRDAIFCSPYRALIKK
jgi:hypothetical protein